MGTKICEISTNNLWWEGRHFLKSIVEYNNRSRKQTKIQINNSLLNIYLFTNEKKKY